jgi:hypothetical protein
MTQVQTMTNQQLNRKIAELMGYTVEPSVQNGVYRLIKGGKIQATSSVPVELIWSYAPDYAGDPATSLEVQTAAIAKDDEGYVRTLYTVQARAKTGMNINPNDIKHWPNMSISIIAILLSASPRERAEAAYITLSSKQ